MEITSVVKRKLAGLLAVSMLAVSFAGCMKTPAPEAASSAPASSAPDATTTSASATETTPVDAHRDAPEINETYLTQYFGVQALPDAITWKSFNDAMTKVAGVQSESMKAEEAVSFLDAVKLAVIGANFEELALTYPAEKSAASLKKNGVEKSIDSAYASYLACAFDTLLITKEQAAAADANTALDKATAMELLMAVADANGTARNFIGYTDEADIYSKLINAREAFVMFDNEKLSSIGAQAVMNKVTTGYNLRNSNYDAKFIPELTLRYGHSTTKHASQLLGLLASEGIVAKVQLEPKTSIFEYLPEWGDIPPATPEYVVERINDNLILAFSSEYDMVFEFATQEDKLKFDGLIMDYAKKDAEDQKGLLFASWWQPLYVSSVEMKEGYNQIYDNVITDGVYSLHPFCLPEDLEKVAAGFKAIDPAVKIEAVPLWCDEPFYRYLKGDFQ
ncbi:hypothetical protein V6615_05975 [Oscillospiraceae bacterium PP1C4]